MLLIYSISTRAYCCVVVVINIKHKGSLDMLLLSVISSPSNAVNGVDLMM